jgi:hypothetical protein
MKWARWKSVGIGTAVVCLSGCFSYRIAEPATVPEGADVRVHMTRLGFATLPEIPNESGPSLAGTLVRRTDDQILLRVPVATPPGGLGGTIGQEVVIPTRDVVRFERREFNASRTGLTAAGGLLTAVVLYLSFEKGNPPNPDEPEPPEEEGFTGRLARIVLFSIRIR